MRAFSTALAAIGVAAMAAATVIPTGAALAAPRQPSQFQDHGSYATYGNYRGDRNSHPGYQQFNGYWFPPGAFIAGAIVGGILGSAAAGNAQTYAYAGSPHVTWCEQNYRSYNPGTDTYLGYDGAYHYCVSPY